jgi:HlyD family secretion protein
VDFNDHVEKGQILLELDDSLLTPQIAQSEASVRNAQASLELAQANEARNRTLYNQEYVAKQDLDISVQALKSARAQLDTASSQLRRDKTNLSYTIIRSPVSGVVVNRAIDVGQTVASSFQTPTLIQIAQDLSKMQIDTSFAEADIGNIKVGQLAKFNVDAFPNRNFEGIVKQVRLNPTVTTNVVTYDVVVSVDNLEQILLPGMTAYVNITVAKHSNVLLVPNAALRFKPTQADDQTGNGKPKNGQWQGKKKSDQGDVASGKVYVLSDGKPTPIRVKVGISDGKLTEISSDKLKENDKVIIGENQADSAAPATSSGSMKFRMF